MRFRTFLGYSLVNKLCDCSCPATLPFNLCAVWSCADEIWHCFDLSADVSKFKKDKGTLL